MVVQEDTAAAETAAETPDGSGNPVGMGAHARMKYYVILTGWWVDASGLIQTSLFHTWLAAA